MMTPDPNAWSQSIQSITEDDVQRWLNDHRAFQSASMNETTEENHEQGPNRTIHALTE